MKRPEDSEHRDISTLGTSGFDRDELDRYWTEPRGTEALYKYLAGELSYGDMWEPAVGRGDMAGVIRDHLEGTQRLYVSDIDMSEFEAWKFEHPVGQTMTSEVSFLGELANVPQTVRAIITNPPNRWATDFCRKSIALMEPVNGMVCMLMPNEFDNTGVKDNKGELFDSPYFAMKIILRPMSGAHRLRWDDWRGGEKVKAPPRRNYSWYIWICRQRIGGVQLLYYDLPGAIYPGRPTDSKEESS